MNSTIHTVAAALALTSPFLLQACSKTEVPPDTVLRPVRVQQVYATGGNRIRKFAGVAQSGVESKISFKVTGTIRSIPVSVGDTVRRGQLIAELDGVDYRLQVQDAEAALSRAKASERNEAANYERVRSLYENRNASKQELESARAAYESAAAGVKSAENRLGLARNQLAYCKLKAPIDGSVAAVNVEINENVASGQVIVLLTSGSDIQVNVGIPEILIAQINEGDPVAITFDALPGREIPGRVIEVGVAAIGTATTFPVTVQLDSLDPDIRSGMAAEVAFSFQASGTSERFLLPPIAVGEDRQGRFVYIVEESEKPGVGVVRRKNVAIGELIGTDIEITEGLTDGDHVVIAGVSKIVNGQEVKFRADEGIRP